MVRLYIEAEGVDLPLDFEPDEAEEIAGELIAAAAKARAARPGPAPGAGGAPRKAGRGKGRGR